MSEHDASLGHHLDEVTGTELGSEVPSHAQDDDFAVKVSAFEEFQC